MRTAIIAPSDASLIINAGSCRLMFCVFHGAGGHELEVVVNGQFSGIDTAW